LPNGRRSDGDPHGFVRPPDSLDLHVASAPAIGDAIDSLITYDKRMLDAARETGLVAFAPGVAG
jgi:hypothetical protein